MSQARFAQELGTSEITVNRWENNHAHPEGAAARWLCILDQRVRAYERKHSPDVLGDIVRGAAVGLAIIAVMDALFGKGK